MSSERSESTLLGCLQSIRQFNLTDDQRRALETAIAYIADLVREQCSATVVHVPKRGCSGPQPRLDPRQAALKFRRDDDDGIPY